MVVVGFLLALVGGFFTWYLWHQFQAALAMRAWPRVPATVLAAKIEPGLSQHGTPKHTLWIRYRYTWEGTQHEGERVKRRPIQSSQRPTVENWLNEYPVGTETECYVNPADPSFAVLVPDSKAAIYSIWLPAFFLLSGVLIMGRAALGR